MAGALGENYLVQIEIDGDYEDVACQGDVTINTGKTLEISRTKNCKHPFFRDEGFTAQFTIELETPANATHSEIMDAADDQEIVAVKINSSDTGAPVWTGDAYVTYDPVTAPTEGPVTMQITVAFVDDPVRSAAA